LDIFSHKGGEKKNCRAYRGGKLAYAEEKRAGREVSLTQKQNTPTRGRKKKRKNGKSGSSRRKGEKGGKRESKKGKGPHAEYINAL